MDCQPHNHRSTEWLEMEDTWRLSSPTLLLKQVHLGQTAQDHIQAGFKNLQRRRFSPQSAWAFCASALGSSK